MPFDCQTCGACCAYSDSWPELDQTDNLPDALVDYSKGAYGAMRCNGDRCQQLRGTVGKQVSCAIYAERPWACRNCEPGGKACLTARTWLARPKNR
jgi:Fe-S-cluster containining protein